MTVESRENADPSHHTPTRCQREDLEYPCHSSLLLSICLSLFLACAQLCVRVSVFQLSFSSCGTTHRFTTCFTIAKGDVIRVSKVRKALICADYPSTTVNPIVMRSYILQRRILSRYYRGSAMGSHRLSVKFLFYIDARCLTLLDRANCAKG